MDFLAKNLIFRIKVVHTKNYLKFYRRDFEKTAFKVFITCALVETNVVRLKLKK